MTQSPDHPDLTFVQAAGYTTGRPDGPPLWIVVHDMEAGETRLKAEDTAAYFADPPDGRRVSSHYCVDSDSVVQCVRLGDVAWTVGNRPGNYRGINWELAGFAAQTREQWLDAFGLAMFAQMRPIVRADAAKYGIPLERRTVAELLDRQPGITSHNDLRLAFGGTTHTDPGPNFPWDVFLATMNEGDGGFMAGLTEIQQQDMYRRIRNIDSWMYYGFAQGRAEIPAGAISLGYGVGTPTTEPTPFKAAEVLAEILALASVPPTPVAGSFNFTGTATAG